MPKVVLDMNDRRPAWSLPSWVAGEIRGALPAGWTLVVMDTPADGSGDGMVNLDSHLLDVARDAEIYLGYGVPAALIREGKALRWVHSGAAGVRGSLTPEMLSSPVLFTNSKGVHGPPIGDTVMAMILYFARGLDFAVANMRQRRWSTEPFYAGDHPLLELPQSTVGVFGYGGIGHEVARRVRAMGGRVLAYDREPPQSRDPGVHPLFGKEGFRRLLAESDFLVLTAPETPETRGVMDREALGSLKPGVVLVNVSRGALVEETALIEALQEGRIRGAGLDVFATEPLPEAHPLWSLPNVILTPHVSAVSRGFWRRETDLIVGNLQRFFAGRPLLNLVDKNAGF